ARRQLTGWRAEIQGGYDFQFFDSARLDELDEIQNAWNLWHEKKQKEKEQADINTTEPEAVTTEKRMKTESTASNCILKESSELMPPIYSERDDDIFSSPPLLKDLSEEQLRRVLHVVEFHMRQHHDHKNKTKFQLYKRCRDLITSPSMDEFVFTKANFNEALTDLEAMLSDGRAWEMQMPAATDNRSLPGDSLAMETKMEVSPDGLRKSSRLRKRERPEDSSKPSPVIEEDEIKPVKFSREMQKEKDRLISQGFINWNRADVAKLVNGIILYGKDRLEDVWSSTFKMGNKTLQDVKRYAAIFFERYEEIEGGERMMSRIRKAELEHGALLQQNEAILQNVEEQVARGITKPQVLQLPPRLPEDPLFSMDEDKVLLWGLYEHGATAYEKVHVASRYYWYDTRGFFSIATKTLKAVEDRCNQIVTAVENEWLQQQEKRAFTAAKISKGNQSQKARQSASTPATAPKARDTEKISSIRSQTSNNSTSKQASQSSENATTDTPNGDRKRSESPKTVRREKSSTANNQTTPNVAKNSSAGVNAKQIKRVSTNKKGVAASTQKSSKRKK
ncbi:hypothetical protein IE077_001807, partial [Cardiosporidium cionae]